MPHRASASRALISAAALITLGSLTSRVLGLVREQVIAALFGASADTSVFATAITVPTMVYDLLIGGAVSAALVPVFSGLADGKDRAARDVGRAVGTVLTLAGIVLTAACALLVLLAEPLAVLLGVSDGADLARTVRFIRLVLPSVVPLGLSAVLTGYLYARQRFVFPAFAAGLFNLGIIVCAPVLAAGSGAEGLIVGVLAGSALQFAFVCAGAVRAGLKLGLDFRSPAVRQIVKLYAPVAAGLLVSQIGVIIDRNLAWRTGAESLAVMRFATTLVQLPLGLVATATGLAALPMLSRFATDPAGLDRFKQALAQAIRLCLLAIMPAFVALAVLREPIIQLLFERQAFDRSATAATAMAFLLYSPQLPFVAVDQLLIFAFYSRRDTRTPMLVGLLGVGIYLAAGLALIGPAGMGVYGLVLANTIQNTSHALLLLALFVAAVGSMRGLGLGRAAVASVLASAPVGAVCFASLTLLLPTANLAQLALSLTATIAVAVPVYAAGLRLLRVDEIGALGAMVARRLRRAPASEDAMSAAARMHDGRP
jgi:putative peptidoglycan lipid II flippase